VALPSPGTPHLIGRYAIYGEIAAGGMATVHYGRLVGPVGFSRTVAIKRLHAHFAKDPEFAAMFLDEARLAARIRHPNVVQTLDVVALDGELFLVMDYVQGESLVRLIRASVAAAQPFPLDVLSGIICGALHGLHAAHEAKAEQGEPLGIVHRDVSPQNVLVCSDGLPRVLDFGVAKAAGRVQTTREGQLKGKLAYMSPEQIRSETVDRRTDVYAMGVVLWEAATLQRLFAGEGEGAVIQKVLEGVRQAPSAVAPHIPKSVDGVAMRALEQDPTARFQTAREMALALEACVPMASSTRIAEWVDKLVGDVLVQRARTVAEIESQSGIERTGEGIAPGDAEETQVAPPRNSGSLPDADGSSAGSQASIASLSRSAKYLARGRSSAPGKTIGLALAGLVAITAGAFALTRSGARERERPVAAGSSNPPPASAASSAPQAVAPASAVQVVVADSPKVGVLTLRMPQGYTVKVDGVSPGSPESHGSSRALEDGKLELRGEFQTKFLVAIFDGTGKRVMVQDVYLYDNTLDPPTIDPTVGAVSVEKPKRKVVPKDLPAASPSDLPARF
jgi:eukaryotic-like serine/threonine-protein kinase